MAAVDQEAAHYYILEMEDFDVLELFSSFPLFRRPGPDDFSALVWWSGRYMS